MITELDYIKESLTKNTPYQNYKCGKLIRSKLGLLWLKSQNISITQPIINFLTAIELIHNASLLHDDVLDNETTRRGTTTLNSSNGNKYAVLNGNLTLISALSLIEDINVIKLVTETIKKMCEGEIIQISQLNKITTIEEYLNKTELKTASLFESIFKGLYILTQEETLIHAKQFGKNYGIGFQIQNDLNDYNSGIQSSKDIQKGIYTAPIILINKIEYNDIAIEKTISLIDNYKRGALEQIQILRDNKYKTALIKEIECLTK